MLFWTFPFSRNTRVVRKSNVIREDLWRFARVCRQFFHDRRVCVREKRAPRDRRRRQFRKNDFINPSAARRLRVTERRPNTRDHPVTRRHARFHVCACRRRRYDVTMTIVFFFHRSVFTRFVLFFFFYYFFVPRVKNDINPSAPVTTRFRRRSRANTASDVQQTRPYVTTLRPVTSATIITAYAAVITSRSDVDTPLRFDATREYTTALHRPHTLGPAAGRPARFGSQTSDFVHLLAAQVSACTHVYSVPKVVRRR